MTIIILFSLLVAFVGLGTYMVLMKFFLGIDYLPGGISVIVVVLIGFGAQGLFLGTFGLYLTKILKEVQGHTLFSIDEYLPSQNNDDV